MASAKATSDSSNSECCVRCSNKHNRIRASFCQCKHCSIPLCFDCMKEHHDELLQDVEQISHQYNELQQLVHSKHTMIVDETAKCVEDVNRYFETYFDQLRATQNKIIADMEIAKQNAQDHVQKLDAELRLIGGEIQGLAKESVVQTDKMRKVSLDLKDIEEQVSTYQVIRTETPIDTQPEFFMKFGHPSVEHKMPDSTKMEVNEISCKIDPQEPPPPPPPPTSGWFSMIPSFSVEQKPPLSWTQTNHTKKTNNNNSSTSDDDEDDSDSNGSHIDTSYDVDRMASDGENILYTSYDDDKADRIAYCCMDDDNDDEDDYRHWNYSRIVDMVWWSGIKKFVCATKKGIYTVDYVNRKFKITEVVSGKWSYIRVAENSTHLFAWIKSGKTNFHGIEIYSLQLESIRKIDLNKFPNELFLHESVSFCVTDNLIASIDSRMQNNRKILEVTFCDMDMKKSNSITLDECNRNTEIRTNGKDRFFITTGGRSFHIVSSQRLIQTIELKNNGKWISVTDDQDVAVSNGRSDIQLVPYTIGDHRSLFK